MNEINSCEVCGNLSLDIVLNLGLHPMCDDLVPVDSTRICNEYPIEILYCKECNTAHQRYQVPKKELFPTNYHYRSRFTADVLAGMEGLVDKCIEKFGPLSGKSVLDVGCNDGSLLDFFAKKGANTFGVEPTGAFLDAVQKGHRVLNEFLSERVAEELNKKFGKPDIITFTNVFAHIENLTEVLRALKILMKNDTVIVIENHYLGAVLDGNQFDTFYHEHPRTYSYSSFKVMAKSLGLELLDVEFPSRYGGNIRVIMGPGKSSFDKLSLIDLEFRESMFFGKFHELQRNVKVWQVNKKIEIEKLCEKYGKIRAKAFPGRAAILVKMLNLDSEKISAVYEKPGSLKIGHYLPGTNIEIISDESFDVFNKDPIINLAWHIPSEIRNYMSKMGYDTKIIDIIENQDFK